MQVGSRGRKSWQLRRRGVPEFCRGGRRRLATGGRGARGFLSFVAAVLSAGSANSFDGRWFGMVAPAGVPVSGDHWRSFCRCVARETTVNPCSPAPRRAQYTAWFCFYWFIATVIQHREHEGRGGRGIRAGPFVAHQRRPTDFPKRGAVKSRGSSDKGQQRPSGPWP